VGEPTHLQLYPLRFSLRQNCQVGGPSARSNEIWHRFLDVNRRYKNCESAKDVASRSVLAYDI
jgi:hypothetical protein